MGNIKILSGARRQRLPGCRLDRCGIVAGFTDHYIIFTFPSELQNIDPINSINQLLGDLFRVEFILQITDLVP